MITKYTFVVTGNDLQELTNNAIDHVEKLTPLGAMLRTDRFEITDSEDSGDAYQATVEVTIGRTFETPQRMDPFAEEAEA